MTPAADKARFLKALAFEIRRKRPAEEALNDCIQQEGRSGKHKAFRQAAQVLEAEGFVAALQAAGLVGDEAASVLALVLAENDHRQLAGALAGLAAYHDSQD